MTMKRLTRSVRINNTNGLHMRAAAVLSQLAQRFPCEIGVTCGERHADAKSILELLGLVAEPGRELVLEAQGPESEEAVRHLAALVARRFDLSEESCHENV